MSVIKKYQTGKPIIPDLGTWLGNQLDNTNFSREGRGYANEAVNKFKELYEKEGNHWGDVFKLNPVDGKYTVNSDNIQNSDLKQTDWSGSQQAEHANIFGRHNGNDIRGQEGSGRLKYMGAAAALINKYHSLFGSNSNNQNNNQTNNNNNNTKGTPLTYNIDSFENYLSQGNFNGGKPDFNALLPRDDKNKINESTREGTLFNLVKTFAQNYVNQKNRPDQANNNYPGLEKVSSLLNILNTPNNGKYDWNAIRPAALALGWNLDPYLNKEGVNGQSTEEKAKAYAEEGNLFAKDKSATFQVPIQAMKQYASLGYREMEYGLPGANGLASDNTLLNDNKDWFYMSGKDSNGDPLPNRIFNKDLGEITGPHYFNNPTSSLYGSYIAQDKMGNWKHFMPAMNGQEETKGYDGTHFQDNVNGSQFRGLNGQVNGNSGKYHIKGIGEQGDNGWNYTDHLILSDPLDKTPDHKQDIELHKEVNDNNTPIYKDNSGKVYKVNIDSFNDKYNQTHPYFDLSQGNKLENDDFKNLTTGKEVPFNNLNNEYQQIKADGISNTINEGTANRLASLISNLRYKISNGTNYTEKLNAADLYSKVYNDNHLIGPDTREKIIKQGKVNSNLSTPGTKRIPSSKSSVAAVDMFGNSGSDNKSVSETYKKGGTLKFISGGGMSFDDYAKKYNPSNSPNTTPNSTSASNVNDTNNTNNTNNTDAPIKDWRGTFKDSSTAEKISVAGAVASLIPVLGAVGGATTLGADAYRKFVEHDNNVGWGTLGLDTLFTGLGLVGAGGIGTAAKIIRGGTEVAKIGELGKLAMVGKDVAGASKLGEASIEALKGVASTNAEKAAIDIIKGLNPDAVNNLRDLQSLQGKSLGKLGFVQSDLDALKASGQIKPNASLNTNISKTLSSSLKDNIKTVDGLVEKSNIGLVDLSSINTGDLSSGINKAKELSGTLSDLDKSSKVGKAIDKISQLPDELVQKIASSQKDKTLLSSILNKEEIESLQNLGYLDKTNPSSSTAISGALQEIAGDIQKMNDIKISPAITAPFSGTKEILDKLSNINLKIPNALQYGLMGVGAAGGTYSAIQILKDYTENNNAGDIKTEDVKNALFALSGVRGLFKERQVANLVKNASNKFAQESSILKMGDQDIPIAQKFGSLDKLELKTKGILNSNKSVETFNQKVFDTANEKLKALYPDLKDENLIKDEKGFNSVKNQLSSIQYRIPTFLESGLSLGDYNEMKSSAEGKHLNYWMPKPLIRALTSHKKGGILKAQSGENLPGLDEDYYDIARKAEKGTGAGTGEQSKKILGEGSTGSNFLNSLGSGVLNGIGKLNMTDATNILQLFNSNNANTNASALQRKALADSYSPISRMQKINIKTPTPIEFAYNNQAANLRSTGNRIAKNADLNQGALAQLESENKAGGVELQGKLNSANVINSIQQQQRESDANVLSHNIGVNDQNNAQAAGIRKGMDLINSNLVTANASDVNNFLRASQANFTMRKAEMKNYNLQKQILDLSNDPTLKEATANFNNFYKSSNDWKNKWDTSQNAPGMNTKIQWDKSTGLGNGSQEDFNNQLNILGTAAQNIKDANSTKVKMLQNNMMPTYNNYNPYQQQMMQQQMMQQGYPQQGYGYQKKGGKMLASGGSLSDKMQLQGARSNDKMALESMKDNDKAAIENSKQLYKSLFENSKLMQASLIKVFK